MILDFDGEALVVRIERRPASHSPRLEDAIEFEAEIVMKPRGRVFLNHETQPCRRGDTAFAAGLGSFAEVTFRFVAGKIVAGHESNLRHTAALTLTIIPICEHRILSPTAQADKNH